MYTLKGFVNIDILMDKSPNVTSPLGEISTWSLTYSKDPTEYFNPSISGYRLISLKSYETDTKVLQSVPQDVVSQVLNMVKQTYIYCLAHPIQYNPLDLANTLLTIFTGVVENVVVGPTEVAPSISMPQWISWSTGINGEWNIKIWLADEAIKLQYDEYEITVIPPFQEPLDTFFGTTAGVKSAIANVSISEFMNRIQIAKDHEPETYTRVLSFSFIPPELTEEPIQTMWGVLVYGILGDNQDAMREAIREYVLANSTHTREEWAFKIPDLFRITEFLIIPRWDLYSIPNLLVQAGLYSPVSNIGETIQFLVDTLPQYNQNYLTTNTVVLPHPYKYLTLAIVTGNTNIDEKNTFLKVFPDYTFATSTSLDFNRMSDYTREWIIALNGLLVVAENMDSLTPIPSDMRRIVRSGKLYASFVYDNITYMAYAKNNT